MPSCCDPMNNIIFQKLKVVPVDPKTYGKFYTGDSYIILHTVLLDAKKFIISREHEIKELNLAKFE